ncbi:MAG TPA: HDOD domain-containing protein [Nannocystaceae bacterium]|nr:HDOD domain-containing protein [Nannocystaceae bacterium]
MSALEPNVDATQLAVARALAEGSVELPALPRVAYEVSAAARDPNCGAADISRLLERDPTLCARVLRVANSAVFGTQAQVVSVRQAVARVGATEVATLAMTAAVQAALLERGAYQEWLDAWWRRAFSTALVAKEIARARKRPVDSPFLCGLLHRVGAPVVLRILARQRPCPGADEIDLDRIVAAFELEAGRVLCAAWNLSAPVRATVSCIAGGEEPGEFAEQVHTVRLALELVVRLVEKHEENASALHGLPSAVALDLYPEDLDRLGGLMPAIGTAVGAMR